MYTTAIYMRQKLTNEPKCEFHTTSSRAASLYDPGFVFCNTHEVLILTYIVNGPRDEYQKDSTTANVEPTDVQVKWRHAVPNSNYFCM